MKKISTLLFLSILFSGGLVAQAPKKVILEDYTGAWCGFCPRGLTISNQIEATYPNVIALGIHQGALADDAMASPFSNGLCSFLTNSFPTGGVDRVKFPGEPVVGINTGLWDTYCSQRLNVSAPLNVYISSTYNDVTRLLDVTVTANFVADAVGDLRVHCLLVEDSVTGIGPGYDQHNYMGPGCGAPDPGSPWYTEPCLITGYSHRHVVRKQMANNTWGSLGVIPNPAVNGQNYSKSYSYTLPTTWNDDKMEIVAFVTRYGAADTSRYILNANKVVLGGSVLGIPEPAITAISLDQNFPNPFSDHTYIHFNLVGSEQVSLKIYDLLGKEVTTIVNEKLSGGKYDYRWDGRNSEGALVPGGLYFFRLATAGQLFTKQMTFIRN